LVLQLGQEQFGGRQGIGERMVGMVGREILAGPVSI
jgi:hypothetical protein